MKIGSNVKGAFSGIVEKEGCEMIALSDGNFLINKFFIRHELLRAVIFLNIFSTCCCFVFDIILAAFFGPGRDILGMPSMHMELCEIPTNEILLFEIIEQPGDKSKSNFPSIFFELIIFNMN